MKSRILGWNYGTQLKEFGIWFKIGISWIQFLESGFKRGIQNPSLSWIYIITCTGRKVSRQNNVRLLRTAEVLENTCKSRKEGEIGVYGIAVLSFFMRYFGIIFVNGIAVSSSPAVFGFHPFGWRYLVKEDPSRGYCGTVHLLFHVQWRSIQYATQNTVSIIHDLRNFWQLIYNVIVVVYNDRASRSLYRSIEVFSCFLTMTEVAQDVRGVITLDGCNFK